MKTAISLPDRLYAEAEKTAQNMGIPRSQLFAKALEEFIAHHRRDQITVKLDEVYGKIDPTNFLLDANAGLESLRKLTQHDTW